MATVKVEDVARVVLDDRPDGFFDLIVRELGIPPERLAQVKLQLEQLHASLHRSLVVQLKELLKDCRLDEVVLSHPDADHLHGAKAKQDILNRLLEDLPSPVSPVPLTPEVRAWVLRQHTEDEIVVGLREAREQCGAELKETVQRLEQEMRERERARP